MAARCIVVVVKCCTNLVMFGVRLATLTALKTLSVIISSTESFHPHKGHPLNPCTEIQRPLNLLKQRSVSHQDAWIRPTAWKAFSRRTRQNLRFRWRETGPSGMEISRGRSKTTSVTQYTKAFLLVLGSKSQCFPMSISEVIEILFASLTIAEIFFLYKCIQLSFLLARALWQKYVPGSP